MEKNRCELSVGYFRRKFINFESNLISEFIKRNLFILFLILNEDQNTVNIWFHREDSKSQQYKGNFDLCTEKVSSRKNSTFFDGFFYKKNFPRLFRKMRKIKKLSVQILYKFPTNCKKPHENRMSGCEMVVVSFEGSFSWDTLYYYIKTFNLKERVQRMKQITRLGACIRKTSRSG